MCERRLPPGCPASEGEGRKRHRPVCLPRWSFSPRPLPGWTPGSDLSLPPPHSLGGGAAPSLRGSTPAPAPVHREAIDPATRPPSRLLSPWLGQRSPLPQRPGRDTPLQVRPIVGTAAGALLHPTGTREKRAWPGGLAEGRCGPSCCQLGGGKGSRSPGGQGLRASLRERDGQSTGE